MSVYTDLLAQNPWLSQFNLSPERLQELVATSSGASELLGKLREEPAVKQRTQAMYRQDGSLRFESEGELFRWEDQVRSLLRQSGVNVDVEYATPQSLIGFAESEKSPDELRDNLQVWNAVKGSGDRAREIFYTYAGLSPSDDDLFEALVDPAREQGLFNEYNANVAAMSSGPAAWAAWITRATQAGLSRVAKVLTDAQTHKATKGAAVQRVIEIDPAFARQIMDAIYSGGDPRGGRGGGISLQEMLDAFEFMAIGAAATESGLVLPTKARLQEIRAAGVERNRAIEGYQLFGARQAQLSAAVERARGTTFGVQQFEEASFFGNAASRRALESGEAYMAAAGRDVGTFRFSEQNGRISQLGLTSRR